MITSEVIDHGTTNTGKRNLIKTVSLKSWTSRELYCSSRSRYLSLL